MEEYSAKEIGLPGNEVKPNTPTQSNQGVECMLDQNNPASSQKVNNQYVKQITFESTTHQEDWDRLRALRNENIVTYHEIFIENSVRHLAMDLCLGSMLDYCQKKLPVEQVLDLDLSLLMWDTARGLEFLHENGIIHGHLGLKKILLWRKRPKFKPIVKIGCYLPHSDTNKPIIADDLVALGQVFYSMATNDVNKPENFPILVDNLRELYENQRPSASKLLNLLIKSDTTTLVSSFSVRLLLRHPFFTTNLEQARVLLLTSTHHFLKNVKEFQSWRDQITIENYTDVDKEDFDDLQEILSSTDQITETIAKTFRNYSELISDFIWHRFKTSPEQLVEQNSKFIKEGVISSGAYGIVYKGKWTNEDGIEIPAAGKTLRNESQNDAEFFKEFKLLQKIDHLFVIKCYEMCKIESQTCCIVMELCVGSLGDYVSGELETIPKNTLDDKILLGQVTLGLAYIHSRKMIHKDLKPANILLWKSPTSALVLAKLADLGFAKQLKPRQEEFSKSSHLGTEKFMAPELLVKVNEKEAKASYESDAYSLGIVIGFTVLKGRHPYGNLLFQTPLMSKGCEPILLEELKWDVTDLILKLTKAEPSERPSVALVIYHLYFMLTNEKTKAFVEERVTKYFFLSKDFYSLFSICFQNNKIEAWMNKVKEQTHLENSNNAAFIKLMEEKYNNELFQETLLKIKKAKDNYDKIKEAVVSPNEDHFFSNLENRKRFIASFARNLISNAPELFVSFVWYLLTTRTARPLTDIEPSMADCLNKVTECAFGCLYFEKEEEIEELWTKKQSLKNVTKDHDTYRLLCELPPFATPQKVLNNICNKFDDINYFEDGSGTVLHWLLDNLWWGDIFPIVETLKSLLKKGANPNISKKNIATPIHYGVLNESIAGPEILKILFENGGNPNATDESKRTPICFAIQKESPSSSSVLKLVKTLVEHGARLENINEYCQTALHCAAYSSLNSGTELVKFFLLEKGQDPNSFDSQGRTPVFKAAANTSNLNALEIMQILLENGGNPKAEDLDGYTPLHSAALNESGSGLKLAEMLLNKGVDPNACTKNTNVTPVHYAAINTATEAPDIMKTLLQKGGNPNTGMKFQSATPVHYAARNKSMSGPKIMKALLKGGGNPHALCKDGKTPVHWAALIKSEYGHEVMEKLLERGGDPNAVDKSTLLTPLHYASCNTSSSGPKIMKILLERGGNPNTINGAKSSPVHLAVNNLSKWGPQILKILLENKGNPNAVSKTHGTPIHAAAKDYLNGPENIRLLLENGGNPNILDDKKKTPLDYAIQNNLPKIVELLTNIVESGSVPVNRSKTIGYFSYTLFILITIIFFIIILNFEINGAAIW